MATKSFCDKCKEETKYESLTRIYRDKNAEEIQSSSFGYYVNIGELCPGCAAFLRECMKGVDGD